jgi:L-arabinose isomerase
MKTLHFLIGSQDLYGEETLKQAAEHGHEITAYLNEKLDGVICVQCLPVLRNSQEIIQACQRASCDKDCVGVLTWMHTFSPAKMWIKGLRQLSKPLCHLHTQYHERIPYDTIDMDFMNLNQSAHGDREYGFILARMGIRHHIVVGHYKEEQTLAELRRFAEVAKAIDFSQNLKVAMFGSNMREVAVTDGDRVESQIRYGWEVNYYGIGDLAGLIHEVTDAEAENRLREYLSLYDLRTDEIKPVLEQAKYEIALKRF